MMMQTFTSNVTVRRNRPGWPKAQGEMSSCELSAAGSWRGSFLCEGFFPAARGQLPDVFVGMLGQAPKDIVQVGVRFDSQPFATDHERKEMGRLLASGFLADVQPVLAAHHHL